MTNEEIREWLLRIEDLNMMHRKNHHKVSVELARLRKALEAEEAPKVLAVVEGWATQRNLDENRDIGRMPSIWYQLPEGQGETPNIPVTATITEGHRDA